MIPPTTDPADKQKADALDRWVQRQKEEAMRNLPKDLEVLPSPLLLEQMEREAVQRRSPPAPLAAHSGPAVKSSPSSRHKKRGVEHLPVFQPVRSLSRLLPSCLEWELPCLLAGGLQQVSPLLCLPHHHLPGSLHLRPCRLRSLQPGVLRQHLTSWRSD
ncbi:hypothetical protein CRENBAI_004564 [Crenichthys baileyi]|uniref:Uncharacterized protein n=1 Tax=Crenichthys baileyi TaxID=28760 RepID=A0AAV9SDK2_9TELE